PGGPTSSGVICGDAASSAPATTSSGALSPPIASTAMRAKRLGERGERLDLAAAIRLAGRAHLVRPGRLVAVRAEAQARRGDAVLGTALVAARLGGFSLRDCHERSASIAIGRPRPFVPRGGHEPGLAVARVNW